MDEPLRLIKLILNNKLYNQYKTLFVDSMFPSPIDKLWETIQIAHEKYNRDITEHECLELLKSNNGTITRAAQEALQSLLIEVYELPSIGPDVAEDVLRAAWKQELGRSMIEGLMPLIDNRSSFDPDSIQSKLDQIKDNYLPEIKVEHTPTDVPELLSLFDNSRKWEFNIKELQRRVGGISPGEFAIVAARPEIGKTLLWISLACGPGGWCEQGAKVAAVCNEEWSKRNMLRAVSCNTSRSIDNIKSDPIVVNTEFNIRDNIRMLDGNDFNIEAIETYCRVYEPDILIVDQLDKIKTDDKKDTPTHERIRHLYTSAREIAKKYNCVMIGISQLSAEAEGKTVTDYSMLEGSKTGKAAECDLAICIGSNPIIEQTGVDNNTNLRFLNLSKNKLSGDHGQVVCKINPTMSQCLE